jgi:alpha-galactosidase
MRHLYVAVFGALLAQSCFPQLALTGHWVAEQAGSDGEKRQTVFNCFTPKNGAFTGYISGMQGDKGSLSDAGLTISIVGGMGAPARGPGGGPPGGGPPGAGPGGRGGRREMIAKRISSDEPTPMPPPPVKITTGEYKSMPFNGLAKTPPMGWNNWNNFQRRVNDQVVREIAAAMAKNGMKEAGYVYANIDDIWEGARDAQGNIQTNEKFPDMKALFDYVHSLGLKLGVYSSPGPKTCAGFEGSFFLLMA